MMLLLTCCIMGVGLVMAQSSKVTGKVLSDEDGEAIIGATVMVKGTTIGTVTDADGFFNLSNVPNSAKVLEISFVGMETMTVKIAPNLTIRMKNSSEMLDEVLVTGTYGSAKKLGSMVGSVAAVKSEKISNRPSANFADALQGQVAGLYLFRRTERKCFNAFAWCRFYQFFYGAFIRFGRFPDFQRCFYCFEPE